MMKSILTSLFLCVQIICIDAGTPYDDQAMMACQPGESIYRITSTPSNYEDRSWTFLCLYSGQITSDCSWTFFVNNLEEELSYECPQAGVITGVISSYINYFEDSIFRYQCCRAVSHFQSDCYWTDFVNAYDGDMNYTVPYQDGYFLAGAKSYHDKDYGDRIWKFFVCKY